VSWRETSEFDPGSVSVFLRNISGRPQRLSSVSLDGLPVRTWGVDDPGPGEELPALPAAADDEAAAEESHEELPLHTLRPPTGDDDAFQPVYWARLLPEAVPPGGVAELTLKLTTPLRRAALLELQPEASPAFAVRIRPAPSPLSIALAVFSPELDRLYVYVDNAGATPLSLDGLEMDGRPVAAWRAADTLAPGGRALFIHDLDRPATPGAQVFVKAAAADGQTAMARIRVFGGFPLGMQFGASPGGYGLDPGTYTLAAPKQAMTWRLGDAGRPAAPLYSLNGVLPMDCPLCAFGMVDHSRFRTARELLRRYAVCAERFPSHPALVHVCRIRAESGYALFAEVVDLLSFNPSTTWAETTKKTGLSPQAVVERLCGYAARAAAPRPFLCMADTARIGTRAGEKQNFAAPYEFRTRIFTLLGLGAKGLLYRHNDAEGTSESAAALNPAIPPLNAEVRTVRDLLAVAAPLPGSVHARGWEAVKAYPLLAGDRALVIFLVRQEAAATPAEPGTTVELEMDVPAWAAVRRVSRVTPEGFAPMAADTAARPLTFIAPLPEAAGIYVVELARTTP